jgi:NitT/TauT family transport system permease protein
MSARHARTLISALAVMTFLALWQIAPAAGWVKVTYVSQPSRVLAAGFEIVRSEGFPRDLWVSFTEFAAGFALAVVIGVPLGLLLGTSGKVRSFVDPPLMAIYATPYLALLPILVVWLGIGMGSKIAAVFAGGLFPIVVNSMAGVRQVERSWVLAAQSFGATRGDLFRKVILPSALPSAVIGVRLGLSRAVLAVVVAEMYVAQAGIGYQIMRVGSAFRIDALLFYVVLVSVVGYAATSVVRWMEVRWFPAGK